MQGMPSASARKQAENKDLWNEARSPANADFFTIGYTGRKTEAFFDSLTGAGVSTLVDIRQNAVSMYRPELSKSNLRASLAERNIAYLHMPELGVPRDIRAKAIDSGTRDVIWDWYDRYVVDVRFANSLHLFFNFAEHPVALMCTELDPTECHRHRIFIALEKTGLRGYDL